MSRETNQVKAPQWAWWLATGFGSGRLEPAPGTWGSLAGLVVWCLFVGLVLAPGLQACGLDVNRPALALTVEASFVLVLVCLTWLSVKAADHVVCETGGEDPSYIVADEWVGMWVALWPLRWIAIQEAHRIFAPGGWRWLLLLLPPFLAFRLFDIWKPWPIDQLQELPGGQGIVADDLVAGLYSLPLVTVVTHWLLAWLMRFPA